MAIPSPDCHLSSAPLGESVRSAGRSRARLSHPSCCRRTDGQAKNKGCRICRAHKGLIELVREKRARSLRLETGAALAGSPLASDLRGSRPGQSGGRSGSSSRLARLPRPAVALGPPPAERSPSGGRSLQLAARSALAACRLPPLACSAHEPPPARLADLECRASALRARIPSGGR